MGDLALFEKFASPREIHEIEAERHHRVRPFMDDLGLRLGIGQQFAVGRVTKGRTLVPIAHKVEIFDGRFADDLLVLHRLFRGMPIFHDGQNWFASLLD